MDTDVATHSCAQVHYRDAHTAYTHRFTPPICMQQIDNLFSIIGIKNVLQPACTVRFSSFGEITVEDVKR